MCKPLNLSAAEINGPNGGAMFVSAGHNIVPLGNKGIAFVLSGQLMWVKSAGATAVVLGANCEDIRRLEDGRILFKAAGERMAWTPGESTAKKCPLTEKEKAYQTQLLEKLTKLAGK